MRHDWAKALLGIGLGWMLATAAAAQPENCIPTCDGTDSRMLVVTPGTLLETLTDDILEVEISVAAGTPSFDLGVFDGEIGGLSGSPLRSHWDICQPASACTSTETVYTLLADPLGDGTGTFVVATFDDATMPDNDWVDFTIGNVVQAQSPSGNYVYRLQIVLDLGATPTGAPANAIKLRSSAVASIEVFQQPFSFIAALTGIPDAEIVYEDFDITDIPATLAGEITYDGDFSFYLQLDEPQEKLVVWDGDLDHGKFDCSVNDTDDANSPALPDDSDDGFPAAGTPAAEGMAVGTLTCPGGDPVLGPFATGAPADDLNPAQLGGIAEIFLRSPSIFYEILKLEEDGSRTLLHTNANPSGNSEWEKLRLESAATPPPADPDGAPDATVPELPAGVYEVRVKGLDMQNLNAFYFTRLLCQNAQGEPCRTPPPPLLVGDTVFLDLDGNGMQDPGEPGIPGVVVELLPGPGQPPIATRVTGDPSAPDWDLCQLNNTGLDADGLYCFGVRVELDDQGNPVAQTRTVQISAVNFLPGGALFELFSTTGGEVQTKSVLVDNVLTHDFGYAAGSIGDRVWLDVNGNGLQDDGATGLNGVTVILRDAGGAEIATAVTTGDGNYLFDGLPPGGASSTSSTFPARSPCRPATSTAVSPWSPSTASAPARR